MFADARKSADARMKSMGVPAPGDEMTEGPEPGQPAGEDQDKQQLMALIQQIPDQSLANQIMQIVARLLQASEPPEPAEAGGDMAPPPAPGGPGGMSSYPR